MVLQALKEVFSSRERTTFLRVGSSFPVEVPLSTFQFILFSDPAKNIAEAQKEGIQPVNFHQILEQFSKDQILDSVLFDSAPLGFFPGNHWRITELDERRSLVTMQLCGGPFGNHDAPISPFTVSQYDILFTGMATQRYEHKGRPIPLYLVNERIYQARYGNANFVYPKDIEWKGETIYWADAQGKLITSDKHPLFSVGLV